MQSLSRSIVRNVGRVAPATPRWWLSVFARRDAILMNEKKQTKLDWPRRCFSFATIHDMDKAEMKKAAEESNPILDTKSVTKDKYYMPIISGSSHRDDTIGNKRLDWEMDDRTETRLEPAREYYMPYDMMQIFSLKLAKSPINSASLQLYGYMAARDEFDLKLNYVFRRSRDDPIIVQQGSLIEMTGPKRCIALSCDVLLEFDMRIKNGEKGEDDVQLIDGVLEFQGLFMRWEPAELRIGRGSCGAVDMCFSPVPNAVAAMVEVVISDVKNSFDLSLDSIISVVEVPEEIQLFVGTVRESCDLRKFVIAVTVDSVMHLKFMVGTSDGNIRRSCSFEAELNGYATRQIMLDFASISVKVTWASWAPEILT